MNTIIIGAGAGGLACAIRIKQLNKDIDVTVLEQLDIAGKKLLATGNGRCNLTNTQADGYERVKDFFAGIGLVTRADEAGRVYPYSNHSADVRNILEEECKRLGVKIKTDCTVTEIKKDLTVICRDEKIKGDFVVLATGGKAQKSLGSTGTGYEILKNLGHKITPLYPALVQLNSTSKYPRILKGDRVKCKLSILLDDSVAASEYGEVLFTDYGISGIVTMNLSHYAARNFSSDNPKKCHAVLDLAPDISQEKLEEHIRKFGSLKGILGEKLSSIIEKQAGGDIKKYALCAKNWRLIISGTKGYEFAQITGGGADNSEFKNHESKIINNLYVCGEILDRQFQCGGFNLNHAWLSGIETAENICKKTEVS